MIKSMSTDSSPTDLSMNNLPICLLKDCKIGFHGSAFQVHGFDTPLESGDPERLVIDKH